ncbi:MAG: hypothetical protein OSA99_07000 [Acidimicrobiales bacterium]|nr:hypothetical protein [Acidimicrobiales bacterium]
MSRRPKSLLRLVIVASVTTVLPLAACGDDDADRPELAEWTEDWSELRDLVPEDVATDSVGTDACGEFLGDVRNRRADVIPTPDVSLDEPVGQWVSDAETVGLNCDREGDLDERLRDLATRSEEIDARVDLLDE